MIDLHNHILFNWDDGPTSVEKSIEMAQQAVANGTTVLAATPHRYLANGQSTAGIVLSAVKALNSRLQTENIPLELITGVEIPIAFGIADEIKAGRLTTIGNGGYVLVEPPFPNLPSNLIPAVIELKESGFGVILAHPERNAAIQRDWVHGGGLRFVTECADIGCVLQLTSGSIVGRFGPSAQSVSRAIVSRREFRIIIASDSHDPRDRTPGFLAEARDTVASWIGDEKAAGTMVLELPAEIIGLKR